MRIFMCDVCGEGFKPANAKESINMIKFYIDPISTKQFPRIGHWDDGKLPKPYSEDVNATYNICQKCFDVIRDTLIDLRNTGAGDPPSDSQE